MPDYLFNDLQLTRRAFDRLTSDREPVDLTLNRRADLALVGGRDNLAQAIINRLLTRKGELSTLGHPEYGSRLHELVGEPNNLRLRAKAEIFIRQALAQERRIEKVVAVSFAAPARLLDRDMLKAQIRVKPVGEMAELAVVIPLKTG